jgi:hypothetical protein
MTLLVVVGITAFLFGYICHAAITKYLHKGEDAVVPAVEAVVPAVEAEVAKL